MKIPLNPRTIYFGMLVAFIAIALNFPQASYDNNLVRSQHSQDYKKYLNDTNQSRVYVEENGKSDEENAQEIFSKMQKSKEYKILKNNNRSRAKEIRKKWFLILGGAWLLISLLMFFNKFIKRTDLIIGIVPMIFFASINLY